MSRLLRKQLGDVGDYLRGTANFGIEDRAFTTWAYPLNLDFTLAREEEFYSPRDAAGIPMRSYSSAGRQYNPTRIASWALANYNRIELAGEGDRQPVFLTAADWFARHEDGLWHYEFDWNDLRAPWLSCMAQGQGISVLLRAYVHTGDNRYLSVARAAVAPFTRSIAEGGVRSRIDGRWDFLEEYPSSAAAHVLNGFLFALMGLSDLARVDPAICASCGFDRLLTTIENNTARWDLGYWSAYDLAAGPAGSRNATTPSYHRLHISQLEYIGRRHGLPSLVRTADRWSRQSSLLPNRVRALGAKLMYRSLVPTQR